MRNAKRAIQDKFSNLASTFVLGMESHKDMRAARKAARHVDFVPYAISELGRKSVASLTRGGFIYEGDLNFRGSVKMRRLLRIKHLTMRCAMVWRTDISTIYLDNVMHILRSKNYEAEDLDIPILQHADDATARKKLAVDLFS